MYNDALSSSADVLTIENSRSGDEMIRAMASYGYARDMGPGVYDVVRVTSPLPCLIYTQERPYTRIVL